MSGTERNKQGGKSCAGKEWEIIYGNSPGNWIAEGGELIRWAGGRQGMWEQPRREDCTGQGVLGVW